MTASIEELLAKNDADIRDLQAGMARIKKEVEGVYERLESILQIRSHRSASAARQAAEAAIARATATSGQSRPGPAVNDPT